MSFKIDRREIGSGVVLNLHTEGHEAARGVFDPECSLQRTPLCIGWSSRMDMSPDASKEFAEGLAALSSQLKDEGLKKHSSQEG